MLSQETTSLTAKTKKEKTKTSNDYCVMHFCCQEGFGMVEESKKQGWALVIVRGGGSKFVHEVAVVG